MPLSWSCSNRSVNAAIFASGDFYGLKQKQRDMITTVPDTNRASNLVIVVLNFQYCYVIVSALKILVCLPEACFKISRYCYDYNRTVGAR